MIKYKTIDYDEMTFAEDLIIREDLEIKFFTLDAAPENKFIGIKVFGRLNNAGFKRFFKHLSKNTETEGLAKYISNLLDGIVFVAKVPGTIKYTNCYFFRTEADPEECRQLLEKMMELLL